MPSGTQPKWVHTPIVISQFMCPGLVRSASVCGSRRLDTGTAFASAISLGVRLRTNTGCLRQLTLTPCPGRILARSTSIEASARTSADGLIWTTSGTKAATVPIPAKLTAATLRKSRRRTPSPIVSWDPSLDGASVAMLTLLTRLARLAERHANDAAPSLRCGAIGGPDSGRFRDCQVGCKRRRHAPGEVLPLP